VARLGPGAGKFADGADCAWCVAKDDAVDAGLSCAPAVPVAAYGASTVKFGKWGKKALGVFKGLFVKARKACRVPQANSFTPDTPVVMADGTAEPIKDVRVGDRVLATDLRTGRTGPHTVQRFITGTGAKNLVRFTVDTDGDAGEATGTLTASDNHPLWVPDRHAWIPAGHIRPGAGSWAPMARTVTITATRAWAGTRTVHNLTVAHAHTFYVRAGDATVRVHNDGGLDWGKDSRSSSRPGTPGARTTTVTTNRAATRRRTRSSGAALRSAERDLGRKVTPAERRALHDRITEQGRECHRSLRRPRGCSVDADTEPENVRAAGPRFGQVDDGPVVKPSRRSGSPWRRPLPTASARSASAPSRPGRPRRTSLHRR
jgi:hypothetical protein